LTYAQARKGSYVESSQYYQTAEPFEADLDEPEHAVYILRLYITGSTLKSTRAVHNLMKMCQERLAGRYELEVIDIYQQPGLAQVEDIIAVPTLVKKRPLPVQKVLGDLSNAQRLVSSLGLPPRLADEGSEDLS
jgi:circadian clock protein KaiB